MFKEGDIVKVKPRHPIADEFRGKLLIGEIVIISEIPPIKKYSRRIVRVASLFTLEDLSYFVEDIFEPL
jgi:hypothetical protein